MSSSPVIFNRDHLKQRRARCAGNFQDHDFLHRAAMKSLTDRLEDVARDFSNALMIGPCPDAKLPKTGHLTQCDLSLARRQDGLPFVQAAEDFLPFANRQFDLIVSNLTLHSVNDLPGALIHINRCLKPDGLFIGAMFGGETLYELRHCLTQAEMVLSGGVSPRIFPFADKPQAGSLMQRTGFALPVIDSDIITVTYPDLFALMRDLRGMGEGNIISERRKNFTPRGLFGKAEEIYRQSFADPDGRLRTSFEIIYLHGWAPHESQQKPLRRGSAETRLAEALQTQEISTGIKT